MSLMDGAKMAVVVVSCGLLGLGGIALMVNAGRVMLMRMNGTAPESSAIGVMTRLTVGVALLVGGVTLASEIGSPPGDEGPTTASTVQATDAEQEAIALPQVENLSTLLLVPLALVVVGLGYLLVRRIRRDIALARRARAREVERTARVAKAWSIITERHRGLMSQYLAAETDWDTIFDLPALSDPSVPETAAMLRSMRRAADTDPSIPDGLEEAADLSSLPYPRAVDDFADAWALAERTARRIGQSGIPAHERKKIAEIRQLLRIAEGSGSSPSERQGAYSRAVRLLGSLTGIDVPVAARDRIEASARGLTKA